VKPTLATNYCLDTSSLIAAWVERYPIDHFPRLWDHIGNGLSKGELWVHENVIDELLKRSSDLAKWLKDYPDAIIPFERSIQLRSRNILSQYPGLVREHKAAFSADPFVIAAAIERKLTVVTEESQGTVAKPKIPYICDAEGCQCIRLLDMIRAKAWIV
jgi:predicted nucleic acid-binding protein